MKETFQTGREHFRREPELLFFSFLILNGKGKDTAREKI